MARPSTATRVFLPLFGCFLTFATIMSGLAGILLLFPGTRLDLMWELNPSAHEQLARFGALPGILFLCLSVILMATTVGWFRRRRWAWQLAVIVIAAQIFGDLFNVFSGRVGEGVLGVVIAGSLLFYLVRPNVRHSFGPSDMPERQR